MKLFSSPTFLDLKDAAHQFRAATAGEGSTLQAPSPELIEALIGIPTSSGVAVTRERAIRCVSYLSGVKMLANDIAKMPLCLEKITQVKGIQKTVEAVDEPLYPLLRYTPNTWMTSYQLNWLNVYNLFTQGNFYNQIVRDGMGNVLSLMPLDPWSVRQHWDNADPNDPQRYFVYDKSGTKRRFENGDIWTCSILALNGIEGQAIIALGKDALSMMIASDETAGRFMANGLNVHGFFTTPADIVVDEVDAQRVHDDLVRNNTGSNKAGKFPFLPGGWKYEKMALTAVEGQLLESRKWNAEEVARLLGGQPLITKLGYGQQNATYASSAAFLEDYFSTTLLPITVNIEQTIVRDLIDPADRGILCAEFDEDVITRGSPLERAQIDEINIRSGKFSPNETRVNDDHDPVPGWDVHFFPSNSGVFDPKTGEMFLPGQKAEVTINPNTTVVPSPPGGPPATLPPAVAPPATIPPAVAPKPAAQFVKMVKAAADRIARKEAKGGKIDAEFVAEVLSIPVSKAEDYLAKRKSGEIKTEDVQTALTELILGADDAV